MKKILLLIALTSYSAFAQCVDPILTDFECSGPSHGTYPGTLTKVPNPSVTGINTSANVGRYEDNGTEGFDALVFDYGSAIDLTTNNFLKIKLHTPKSIQILAKLEGGTTAREIWSPFSIDVGPVDSWIEFTFDFSAFSNNSTDGDANTRLVLFVNAGKSDGTISDIYFLDDIQWASSATAGVNDITLEKQIIAFPTITKDKVNIKTTNNNIQNINVYNINGQKVIQNININKQEYLLDVSKLSKGVYFVKVKSNNRVRDIRIIKQ